MQAANRIFTSVQPTADINDIAIYQLSQPVVGVTPSPIFTGTPQVGDELTLVGFGAGGTGDTGHNGDYGTKRVGTTPIDRVTDTLIHWTFDDNIVSDPITRASDLIAYWPFDEGTGAQTADQSGNSHNITSIGGATRTDGKFGKALEFDGIDDVRDLSLLLA